MIPKPSTLFAGGAIAAAVFAVSIARGDDPAKPSVPPTPPVPTLEAPPAEPADNPPARSIPKFPGMEQFITPNGIMLPGGVGIIHPETDRIGIELNTRRGVQRFDIPRRQRNRRDTGTATPAAPQGDTDAPAFGDPSAPPSTSSSTGKSPAPLGPADPAAASDDSASRRARPRDLESAERQFREGDYRDTLRRIDRIARKAPHDPDLIQLRSLTYFAMGNYSEAYRDALASVNASQYWDWPTLRAMYPSSSLYTDQVRALEEHVTKHPRDVEPRFLLGYHYRVLGHYSASARQFEQVAAITGKNGPPTPKETGAKPVPQEPPGVDLGGATPDLGQPLLPVPQARPKAPSEPKKVAEPKKPAAAAKPASPTVTPSGPVSIDLGASKPIESGK